ncbi:MAG: 2-keto-4-pentenoate hydratase [Myxococcota bacterium]
MNTNQLAQLLWDAQASGEPCDALTEIAELTVEDAYAIQHINIERRLDGEGFHGRSASVVGHKVGLTSHAIQDWLGVDEPDFGLLLDDMRCDDGGPADIGHLLQPRAEAEIAFVLGEELRGPGVTTADVLRATDFVLPAIEIIDSRIADWTIQYEDTIADNASSGMFVLGSKPVDPSSFDMRTAGMALRKNGDVVSTGTGAACLGHPANAVVWLVEKLAEFDQGLDAGHVILSGALGPVTDIEPGDWLRADVAHMGSVQIRFNASEENNDD